MVVIGPVFVLFLGAVQKSVSSPQTEDFVFPLENADNFMACTFENGTAGQCVNLSKCLNARNEYQLGIHPTLCRFDKTEPVVCCMQQMVNHFLFVDPIVGTTTERSQTSDKLVKRRKSVALCEDVYSLTVPIKRKPGEFQIAVVGGTVTKDGEFPHMAALGWLDRNRNIEWNCGGTLISLRFVLTAAHCVIGRTPPDIIRIGETDLINTNLDSLPQDFGVESIIGHPDYIPNQLYNDIALIKLDKDATITAKVRPACLWQENAINFTDVTATGYGHTEFGGRAANELLKAELKLFSNEECAAAYQNERSLTNGIVDSQLCAGDSTGMKDTCQGDSGGPISVSTMNGRQIVYHVVGVTSFGSACATTVPGVYTKVSHYLDYIESIVW
ncbi:hypothetical protein HA402_003511 [Bradysia odoriphaga]|nr:hypothetical protein HA402_003511 [Bradysia odoriphaga]